MQKRIIRSTKGTPEHERKGRQWLQIELAGKIGFSDSRHAKVLEEKLAPLAPRIIALSMAGQHRRAGKIVAKATAKLATTFALMALKVTSKTLFSD